MTEEKDDKRSLSKDREIEDRIHQIILACGTRPLKEKVSLLYLSIDYIFEHNKELIPDFCDEITFH